MADRPTLDSFDNSGPAIYDAAERSAYSVRYLHDNTRIGFTDERGPAWHANSTIDPKTGEPAYLSDGTHFPGPVPMSEVERMLDITLEERALFYQDKQSVEIPPYALVQEPDRHFLTAQFKAVERFKGIGIVGRDDLVNVPRPSYVIHQYMDALHGFVQRVAEGADTSSVGVLKNGAVAFLQAVLPGDYSVQGYGYVPYITAATSADSSVSNTYLTGAIGAVCDNTLDQAMGGALTKFKVKHSKYSKRHVQQARERLGIQLERVAEDMGETIESLLAIEVTERDFELWLDEMVPMPEAQERFGKNGRQLGPGRGYTMAENKRDELNRLWTKDPKVKPWAGTAFGIVQANNTWNTWESTVRSAPGGRIERNYLNNIEGKTGAADRKALEVLASVQERRLTFA